VGPLDGGRVAVTDPTALDPDTNVAGAGLRQAPFDEFEELAGTRDPNCAYRPVVGWHAC
jgi:hypothetical protein